MSQNTVVSIGEILYDVLADQRGVPKEEVTSWVPYPGGAPANVVTCTSRLGVRSVLLGMLGTDQLGDDFVNLLKERNVETKYLQRTPDHPTRDVLVTRTADGERTFAGFGKARSEEYADCFVDAEALPADEIKSASVVVSGTLGLAYPGSAAAIRRVVELARAGSATLILDVNWRPVFWEAQGEAVAKATILDFIAAADLLKVTEEEAEWLWGIPGTRALEHPEEVLAKLPGARGVLVSAGEHGSSYAFSSPGGKMANTGIVPVLKIKVSDTTGAGDAFLGGFIYHMLASGGLPALLADPEKARASVEFATACGAFTCTQPGAIGGQPTLEQAKELLATKA
ncbi:Fructokinase-1 [Auxenochlorella protothecoides]|nr:Fructokinase-1 [Auxenochlorella protothecoides]KFM26794.1 Fructokinase-1 [Auxenochlorella protothecoides]RMZ55786.1 hypothetical protein APUTEX25_005827 [Auxenochlorella protothecoides]|eukprot:RMZ55786.1 hypothetical protein APUTEX25_005827 [Auxenochlorella protothecoides]